MADQNDERATVLLRSAESYLSALHVHAARHDNLGAGCELRDQIATELSRKADEAPPATPADIEHCIHNRAVHQRHHHTPVPACPWCKPTP